MKQSQNLMLYFAALLILLVAYVSAVIRLGVLYVAVAGLAVSALAQAGSELLEPARSRK